MRSYRASKSISIATTTSVSVSGDSQPESAIDRYQQGSFAGLSTTVHTPESTYIPAAERYAGLRLLAEVSTLQVDPFVTLATHQAVTFDDEAQEQSATSLSLPDEPLLPNEPSQAAADVDPIMVVSEPHQTEISEIPQRPSGQNLADQNTDSTDKWIMCSGDETRPFKCGYKGCDKHYTSKQALRKHFVLHTDGSQFRCYTGDCTGEIRYWDSQALARHIHKKHTVARPYQCDNCNKRYARSDILLTHRRNVHSIKDGQNQRQSSYWTDKWIMYSDDEIKPFKCGYEGCGRTYTEKKSLRRHFISHIGNSQFRCYTGDCTGEIRYCDSQALAKHIHRKHTMERPFECNICNKRFVSLHNLTRHRRNLHSVKNEQNQP